MKLDPNYVQELQKEFGEDADFILAVWFKVLDNDPTLDPGEVKNPRYISLGKCNEYDMILLHCISWAIAENQKVRFRKMFFNQIFSKLGLSSGVDIVSKEKLSRLKEIFLNRILARFELSQDVNIEICEDFEIVISN